METIKKGDFVELLYTGKANGEIFDSNIEEDLKKTGSRQKAKKTIIIVGHGMLVPGLDKALEGKESEKEYILDVKPEEGFGLRKRELMKMIPLKVFTEKNLNPQPGMVFQMDDAIVKIITISGARVTVDFNNPLAGKDLNYKFIIRKKVTEEKEKVEALFDAMFRFKPEYEIKEDVIVKGPAGMQVFVDAFNEEFKKLIGKNMKFEEMKKEVVKEDKPESSN